MVNGTAVKEAFDFNLTFTALAFIPFNQWIHVNLPKFTRHLTPETENVDADIALGGIRLAPSYYFEAAWTDSIR